MSTGAFESAGDPAGGEPSGGDPSGAPSFAAVLRDLLPVENIDIAPPERRGRVSALGFAVGYAGSLVALGLAWPLLTRDWWALMWVAIAVQWAVFAIPTFKRMPPDQPTGFCRMPSRSDQPCRG